MSQFQKEVLRLLRLLLKDIPIKTEINVKKLFLNYPDHNHHYDIVIPSLKTIFECHGEQHGVIRAFYEKDLEKVASKLTLQKHRDKRKEEEAWDNGWKYIVIGYRELPKDENEAMAFIKKKLLEGIKLANG